MEKICSSLQANAQGHLDSADLVIYLLEVTTSLRMCYVEYVTTEPLLIEILTYIIHAMFYKILT